MYMYQGKKGRRSFSNILVYDCTCTRKKNHETERDVRDFWNDSAIIASGARRAPALAQVLRAQTHLDSTAHLFVVSFYHDLTCEVASKSL